MDLFNVLKKIRPNENHFTYLIIRKSWCDMFDKWFQSSIIFHVEFFSLIFVWMQLFLEVCIKLLQLINHFLQFLCFLFKLRKYFKVKWKMLAKKSNIFIWFFIFDLAKHFWQITNLENCCANIKILL